MRSAFSLVELSVVLAILGLLAGGILAGQSLIRSAELRNVSNEYGRYVAAFTAFEEKYAGLPGDMKNAQTYWGASANCPGTATQGTPVTTCNGNANGLIEYNAATSNEAFRAWQHLANAGLIEGSYNGVTADNSYAITVASTNSPLSKLTNSIWMVLSEDNRTGASNGQFFNYYFERRIFIGGTVTASWPYRAILRPEEAWSIDTKLDDGKPGTGLVTARVANNCTSAATGADYTATYTLTYGALACFLNMTF